MQRMVSYDSSGVKIVLTAPRGEMSSYSGDPFAAFIAVFPEKVVPRLILRPEWFNPRDNDDGSARFMPYGLRKIEALLLNAGIPREDIVSCHPDNLEQFVGPKTKIVGITSMDPMGLAYVSVTYSSMIAVPGETVDAREFRRIMENPVFQECDPIVIVGGAGAWQIRHAGMVEKWGIDVLMHGEGELTVVDL
ncbi:MAG: radical SAM protein, partial [Methanobacteriota archaeon]